MAPSSDPAPLVGHASPTVIFYALWACEGNVRLACMCRFDGKRLTLPTGETVMPSGDSMTNVNRLRCDGFDEQGIAHAYKAITDSVKRKR